MALCESVKHHVSSSRGLISIKSNPAIRLTHRNKVNPLEVELDKIIVKIEEEECENREIGQREERLQIS